LTFSAQLGRLAANEHVHAIPVCGLQDDFTVIKFFKYLRFRFINDAFFGTAVALARLFYRPADQFYNYQLMKISC